MSISDLGLDYFDAFGPNFGDLGACSEDFSGGSTPISQSMVLDIERDEIVKAPVRSGNRSGVLKKTVAALKSHSEAERRRREKINNHLNTLRGLVPYTGKMDKATLLAEVITQVKQMQKKALESNQGLIIPKDNEEIKVEPLKQEDGTFMVKASLNFEYRPDLLSELRNTLNSLTLNIVKAEISTLGNWVRSEFVLSDKKGVIWGNTEECQVIVRSVHQAMSNILEKMSASAEYSPRTTLPYKRRRIL